MTPTEMLCYLTDQFKACSPEPLVWGIEYDKASAKHVLVARLTGLLYMECSCECPSDTDDKEVILAVGKGMIKSMLKQIVPRVLSLVIVADPDFVESLSEIANPENN